MRLRAFLAALAILAIATPLLAKTQWTPVGEGRLEIRTADLQSPDKGVPSVVPLRHTEVEIVVRGFVAEATVVQEFHNALDRPIEAEYVFPLPDDAAVNSSEMRIGERVIRGRIDRRAEARRTYEKAREEGKRTSLIEQERPNIFTQSVANIGPNETIKVALRYVQTLPYADGRYELVFPMVVGPRYIPGTPTSEQARAGRGRLADTDQVPDASRLTPFVYKPGERCGQDIGLTVDIDTGVPLRDLRSRAHQVEVKRTAEAKATVALHKSDTLPNKDFVLELEVAGEQPEIGFLGHHDGKNGYFTLILQPPKAPAPAQVRPREIILVLDCSGSMSGRPLQLSKQAAEKLMAELAPADTFNILSFNVHAHSYSGKPLPATAENVRAGIEHIRSLEAGGGTEMMTGVRAALATPPPEEFMRIVAFFTDGYIGNDAAIIAAVQRLLGPARLFSFGIGSSVNRYLLDRMAIAGRGTAQYVLLNDRPDEVVERFAERLRKPVLTDVAAKFDGVKTRDVIPTYVPDVFAGKPVYLYGRYDGSGKATVEVVGRIGAQPSAAKTTIELPCPTQDHSPLPSIWARQQIKQLEMDKLATRDPKALEERVTQLALDFSLMSAYTSFVAVDETPTQFAGKKAEVIPVRVPVPDGVSYEATISENDPSAGGQGYVAQGARPASGDSRSGGGWGGGPVGPAAIAVIVALAALERRRRRKERR
ncbi:MAG: VWA domain-containing protein [Planctomycetes bacterium]|nr:VWA domain-containing protein [Planctomycetota bacterium]